MAGSGEAGVECRATDILRKSLKLLFIKEILLRSLLFIEAILIGSFVYRGSSKASIYKGNAHWKPLFIEEMPRKSLLPCPCTFRRSFLGNPYWEAFIYKENP